MDSNPSNFNRNSIASFRKRSLPRKIYRLLIAGITLAVSLFAFQVYGADAASYHVRCINESESDVRVWYGLDNPEHLSLFFDVESGAETVSETVDVVWGLHAFHARWLEPGATEWSTMSRLAFIGIYEDQEFVIRIESGDDDQDDDQDDDNDGDDDSPVDSDGDGVPDDQDAFPNDPDETRDSDGDGIGDNADPDDDNDQMPDEWEIENGLDPYRDDADEDPDGDGLDNLGEYEAGTDPNRYDLNFPPAPPEPLLPEDGARQVGIPVTLEVSGFRDPDGDGHASTRWQISSRPVFTDPVSDWQTDTSLKRIEVPGMILGGDSGYYWRARFIDERGAESRWTDPLFFTTDTWAADADGNGMPDDHEFIDYSDMDGNGINDLEQSDIKCIVTAVDENRYMGVQCPEGSGAEIESLDVMRPDSFGSGSGRPDNMPYGLVNFRLTLQAPGETVRLRVYFSEPVSNPLGWYKYTLMEGWMDYSEYTTFSEDGSYAEIEFQDGGHGDADGVANGVIVDPGGVAAAIIDDDDDDDDDGGQWRVTCFINSLLH